MNVSHLLSLEEQDDWTGPLFALSALPGPPVPVSCLGRLESRQPALTTCLGAELW